MTDPYEVLHIPSTATDEEVKRAYRELARKYHPDNYHDNPLADLAQERMKEVNAAYHAIQQERGNRGGGGTSAQAQQDYYGGWQYRQRAAGNPAFQQVRMAINRNDLGMAEQLLDRMDDHNGEWNFLKGAVCSRRGWMDEARRYYQTACQMDPGNPEYRQALDFMENRGASYRPEGYQIFSTGQCGDHMCARLLCTYLLCNFCSCGGIQFFWC